MCVTVFHTSVYADWTFSLLASRIPWHLFVLFCYLKWTNLNLEFYLLRDPSTCVHTDHLSNLVSKLVPFLQLYPSGLKIPLILCMLNCICLFVCLYAHVRAHMSKLENNIQEVFSSLIRWVLGIKLGSSGLSHFIGLQNPSNVGSSKLRESNDFFMFHRDGGLTDHAKDLILN